MMKVTVLLSLMLIGVLCAARTSCDSCGKECEQSCGTRRFRACCFNYLRKKREPETIEFWTSSASEDQPDTKAPAAIFKYNPKDLISRILMNNLRLSGEMEDNQTI